MKQSKFKGAFIYLAIIAALFVGFILIVKIAAPLSNNNAEIITPEIYSEVLDDFDTYAVNDYYLDLGTGYLEYTKNGEDGKIYVYNVPNVSLFIGDIENYRTEYNNKNPEAPLTVNYKKISDNTLLTFLPYLILIILMIVSLFIFMRQSTGGGKMSQFSRANTRNQPASGKKVTFADVAGADEEKQELEEIVDFMKNPKKYQELGARIPKGVLLVGPPGTGKTLLAKAVAGEANVPFFSISGSDFVEMFVGVGASRVRDLFDQAKKHTPSIVFIDEIDAVGRQRGAGLGGGHDEREQTLNQLLVEMDGFSEHQNIIIMAATNRRDILDPALLRPGRFDRQIVVNYPDIKGREEILKVHTKNKKLSPEIDLKKIARGTQGFTGADLENLLNEAALLAARENRKAIIQSDIEEATIKVVTGPEKKSRVIPEYDLRITAYHEAGHAVCTYYCPTQDKVHHVTIIPRGQAAGFTMHLPENDIVHVSRKKLCEELIVLLGGRAAEAVALDDICTGASNDIERATDIARNMVARYGFSEKMGPIVYGSSSTEVFLGRDYSQSRDYSESVAAEIDKEIRILIEDAYKKAEDILTENRDKLDTIAEYLLEHEKMDGAEFEKLMKGELIVEAKSEEAVSEDTVSAESETPENNSESEE